MVNRPEGVYTPVYGFGRGVVRGVYSWPMTCKGGAKADFGYKRGRSAVGAVTNRWPSSVMGVKSLLGSNRDGTREAASARW